MSLTKGPTTLVPWARDGMAFSTSSHRETHLPGPTTLAPPTRMGLWVGDRLVIDVKSGPFVPSKASVRSLSSCPLLDNLRV